MVEEVDVWAENLCRIDGYSNVFTIRDTFVGYTARDTIGSLLISFGTTSSRSSSSSNKDKAAIQSSLMRTATFQGIARSLLSTSNGDYHAFTREICEEYLRDIRHINLYNFISTMNDSKAVVTTYSKYFILDISNKQMFPCHMDNIQAAKLSLFTSERDMVDYINQYYSINNDKSMMIIQCDIVDDKKNLLLLKFEIDRAFAASRDIVQQQQKRFILLLTVGTELYEEDRCNFYDCYFSPGWDHFHIDNIEENEALYLRTVNIVLDDKANSFESFLMYDNMSMVRSIFTEDIMSYLGLIKYTTTTTNESLLKMLADKVIHNLALVDLICKRTIIEIVKDDNLNQGWVYTCACYREGLEFSSSSLVSAMRIFVKQRMRNPATACIYLLEKYNSLDTYASFQLIPPTHIAVFMNTKLPSEEEEFRVNCSSYGKFRFPLCMLLIEKLSKIHNLFITGGPGMNNEGNRLYFINRIKHDIDEFYTENCIVDENYRDTLSIELKEDLIRYFLLSSFGSLKIEAAIVALKSCVPDFDSIELSASQLQVMFWENTNYFRSAVALMIYDQENIILFTDLHRQNETAAVLWLTKIDRIRYDEQNLRIQTFLLIIDFCKVSLAKMKSNISVDALIAWSREIVMYITLVDDLVKITNMNYFTFSLDNDEYLPDVRLYYDLMRY